MAAAALTLLLCLHLFTSARMDPASQQDPSQRHPHLTGCISTDMETFRCRWNVGAFHNLSEPGELRLFYIINKPPPSPPQNWSECPHYSTERPNECFFNQNHTSIWMSYGVQLRSKDQEVTYDENVFLVEDIVQPDPPVSLNYTLLNMSLTGFYYDVMLSWKPPESADVQMGWMTLWYQVQYRDVRSDVWETFEPVKSTHRSLFGLQTNVNHEVRVRCQMLGGKEFGEFSDSVFIHVPSKVPQFPVVAVFVFGALCLVAILMVVIISQQEKLMVILLPPVPGPKIRGIDPELLKKGKLRELTSILGGPADVRPELYNNDPWVEFIDLDMEEQNDRLTDLDTDCLMERSLSSHCSPLSLGFRDDDSGRASCCEPDLPSDPEASPFHPLIPNQEALDKETSYPSSPESDSSVQSAADAPGREALYTQVSEVRSSGKVLLSPEEQTEAGKEKETTEEKNKKNFQLCVVNADHRDYTSELSASKDNPKSSAGDPSESPSETPSPHSDPAPTAPLPPISVYTVVEGVDRQNSFVLTPSSTPAPPQLVIPKTMPSPGGYLTPELLGSITP